MMQSPTVRITRVKQRMKQWVTITGQADKNRGKPVGNAVEALRKTCFSFLWLQAFLGLVFNKLIISKQTALYNKMSSFPRKRKRV